MTINISRPRRGYGLELERSKWGKGSISLFRRPNLFFFIGKNWENYAYQQHHTHAISHLQSQS